MRWVDSSTPSGAVPSTGIAVGSVASGSPIPSSPVSNNSTRYSAPTTIRSANAPNRKFDWVLVVEESAAIRTVSENVLSDPSGKVIVRRPSISRCTQTSSSTSTYTRKAVLRFFGRGALRSPGATTLPSNRFTAAPELASICRIEMPRA